MAFQPLGYRFELASRMTSAEAKAAIRRNKKGWLAPENGPRGWIVGPLMCLWFSAFDRYGPMAVAWISRRDGGTRIAGRAGSDLNGTAMVVLLAPLAAFIPYQIVSNGLSSAGPFLVLAAAFLLGIPLTLWGSHRERRAADPLVHFLRRTIGQSGRPQSETSLPPAASARLVVNGTRQPGPVSADALREALSNLAGDEFLILEFGPETYMQVMFQDESFLVERREGSGEQHFGAELQKGDPGAHAQCDASLQRLVDLMTDYLHGRLPANDLNWERINL